MGKLAIESVDHVASPSAGFTRDPRGVPPDSEDPASTPPHERATEGQEVEVNPSDGLFACFAFDWRVLATPGLSLSGTLTLPGGKVLPRLLPSLRC